VDVWLLVRFGGFACLPLPDVDASSEELSYTLDILGLDGFVLFTNSNGVYLGYATLEPVFEELDRRKTVVYVHPNPSPDAVAHSLIVPGRLPEEVRQYVLMRIDRLGVVHQSCALNRESVSRPVPQSYVLARSSGQ
jgi:pimeloyl-ACP methyl ester carboxylesterase